MIVLPVQFDVKPLPRVPAGGVVHVKHLDERTLPVQLMEVVHPGYEKRISGEVGAGCRCCVVQRTTTTLPAWGMTALGSASNVACLPAGAGLGCRPSTWGS